MKKNRQEREKEIPDEFRRTGKPDKFVQEYWNLVYSVVEKTLKFYRISYTKQDIEDLRNEVFVQFFVNERRRIEQYEQEKGLSLSDWVKLIAQRITLNEIRKKGWLDLAKRNFKVSLEDVEEILVYENYDSGKKENTELIKKAMEKMMPEDKEILNKYFFELMTLQEIAESSGKKYGTVAKMIHDAKIRLKKLIYKLITDKNF